VESLTADVVIIGSGMGGATTAWALAQRGVSVLVLEQGTFLPSEAENWSPRAVFIDRRYKPDVTWFDKEGRGFQPGVHFNVGGSTKVYGSSLPRFRESDFEAVEHHEGMSPAWSIGYADLEPYYAQAEVLYKVHGSTGEDPTEPWRSGPFPHPALPHDPYIADLQTRLQGLGVHPSANAMGIDWEGACLQCRTCDGFPCWVGAKSDAETCALRPAMQTGHVRLRTETRVDVLEESGGRITGVHATGPEGSIIVQAGAVVLSAGSVLSAAMLLKSRNASHPNGLGNRSDQVGRNFMMHNNAHIAAIDLGEVNTSVFQKTLSVNDYYRDGGDGYPLGTMQLIGKVQGIMMKSYATRVPLPVLNAIARRSVEWLIMAEDLPSADNRVLVDGNGRIQTIRTPIGTSTHRRLMKKAKSILRDVGYDVTATQPFDISMNSHQCGTVRMGTDPATSVLDPYCRSHEIRNLWVIDGGFFPSSAAMNPALTIAAQALRVVAESDLAKAA
jgi:choline dehydrogenase-like flavoprotein